MIKSSNVSSDGKEGGRRAVDISAFKINVRALANKKRVKQDLDQPLQIQKKQVVESDQKKANQLLYQLLHGIGSNDSTDKPRTEV